jgi:enolase-phosphatase E1
MSTPRHFDAEAILLDIEGTISSLSFVRDVLFAYSRQRLADFVARHAGDPVVGKILEEVTQRAGGGDPVAALIGWQDRDEKVPPLKKLQGLIWESGYREGAFRSPIFPDALAALKRWKTAGLPLYIYSSGSVAAQELFFQYNEAGDLRPLFSGNFDTDIGAKVDPSSYRRIADAIGAAPRTIVFFSDNARELDAARAAGLGIVHVVKDSTPSDPRFFAIEDFSDVDVEKPA